MKNKVIATDHDGKKLFDFESEGKNICFEVDKPCYIRVEIDIGD